MKRFLALLIIFSLFALPLHAGVTGSVSLANIRLSLVDGTAFADFLAAGALNYLNGKLTITDSAGKKAIGYIKAAGTGETFGDEKITNGNMETGDPPSNWTAGGSATLSSMNMARVSSNTATSGIFYSLVGGTTGQQGRVDDYSIKQQLTPSATGATITSTPGGTTYNWASIEAGFNYNDASGYTYTIIPRFVGGGLGLGIIYGF